MLGKVINLDTSFFNNHTLTFVFCFQNAYKMNAKRQKLERGYPYLEC